MSFEYNCAAHAFLEINLFCSGNHSSIFIDYSRIFKIIETSRKIPHLILSRSYSSRGRNSFRDAHSKKFLRGGKRVEEIRPTTIKLPQTILQKRTKLRSLRVFQCTVHLIRHIDRPLVRRKIGSRKRSAFPWVKDYDINLFSNFSELASFIFYSI